MAIKGTVTAVVSTLGKSYDGGRMEDNCIIFQSPFSLGVDCFEFLFLHFIFLFLVLFVFFLIILYFFVVVCMLPDIRGVMLQFLFRDACMWLLTRSYCMLVW